MPPTSDSARAERRAAILSLAVGVLLLTIKFLAYLLTGSSAILSDAMESIVNVLASAFALYAVILAHRPADEEHPYGHGKVEFFSAGFEGGMIILAAVLIAAQAVRELIFGARVDQVLDGLLLMAIAMIVNGAMGFYLINKGRRTGSITLEADGRHLYGDAVTSAGVIVALALVAWTGWKWIDPLAAIGVAIYITWMATGLIRRSAAGLMDEQDRDDHAMIRGILDSHLGPSGKDPRICSYHKLRHRHSGRYHWVDFHIMLPAYYSVEHGHKIASAIEYEIELAIGEGNATAHFEPCHAEGCAGCELAERSSPAIP